mmetsp:Transcript_98960/g.319048  ORF Transcript_98960/g.319048 Transcript_98960/m.319048 type:complete len:362 (+) Transcript_98960:101-1186(+)
MPRTSASAGGLGLRIWLAVLLSWACAFLFAVQRRGCSNFCLLELSEALALGGWRPSAAATGRGPKLEMAGPGERLFSIMAPAPPALTSDTTVVPLPLVVADATTSDATLATTTLTTSTVDTTVANAEPSAGYPGVYRKAFVINRKVDINRLHNFADTAAAAGVQFEVFEAIDKREMILEKLLLDGEIGPLAKQRLEEQWADQSGIFACTISHNRLWRKLAAHTPEDDVFLVFEDDSRMSPNFHKRLAAVMKSVPNDWDLLYLNHNKLVGHPLPNNIWFKPDITYAGGGKNALLNAYVVRPSGLKRMLRIQHPIDFLWSNDDNLRRHFMDFQAYFLIDNLVPQIGLSVRKNLHLKNMPDHQL